MFEQQSSSTSTSSNVSPFGHNDMASSQDSMVPSEPLPGIREIRIILGGAFFSWLSLALLTFRSTDPSLFHVMVPAEMVSNWCGSFGAHCAAILYVLFGPAAWGILLFSIFVLPRPRATRWQIMGRGLAAFGAMVSAGALFAAANTAFVGPMTGGIFGDAALFIAQWVGMAGCVIAYSMGLLFSLLFFAQVSLQAAASYSYAAVVTVAARVALTLAWFGRWIWAGSSQLWRRRESQEQEKTTSDDTWTGSGDGSQSLPDPFHSTSNQDQEGYGEQASTRYEEQEVTSWDIPTPESDNITSYQIDHEVEQEEGEDEGWHSFMSGEDEQTAPTEEPIEPVKPVVPAPTQVDEVAYAQTDTSFGQEALELGQTDDIWGPPRTGNNSQEVTQEDEETDPASSEGSAGQVDGGYFDLGQESEEQEKVEIPDDEFGFTQEQAEDVCQQEVVVDEAPPIYEPPPVYTVPDATLFSPSESLHTDNEAFMAACQERGRVLEEKLAHFGVAGRVVGIHPGPVITLFEYEPDVGSKVSKIVSLEDDLAMSLKALSIRIIAPVPGKCVVGFEIANEERSSVLFADVIAGNGLHAANKHLPIALGSDIVGNPIIADLATMPHLLVAGATGAGKSVGMNVMLTSLLASMSPDKVRMILIDPKRLEFAPYADVPHLLFPIVTSPYEVAPVLKWVVQEMELRYEVMAQAGVRNIADYHKLNPADVYGLEQNVGIRMSGMPYMVIMIDELADLMMVASKEIETLIARIAQMARAAGIHMIVATQRPSVDVVTGLIKANFPSRIAFRVSTKIDSRTIIDGPGAEKLLGKGDMLYLSPSNNGLQRLHGAYVTDEEINRLTDYLKAQREVEYFSLRQVVAQHTDQKDEETDPLYGELCEYLKDVEEISISSLQRKYRVGFNRSARLIEMLERDGHIAPAQGSKPRRVLRD